MVKPPSSMYTCASICDNCTLPIKRISHRNYLCLLCTPVPVTSCGSAEPAPLPALLPVPLDCPVAGVADPPDAPAGSLACPCWLAACHLSLASSAGMM